MQVALEQLLYPGRHWKTVVLLGTPEQQRCARKQLTLLLHTDPDGAHLQVHLLSLNPADPPRSDQVVFWTDHPALQVQSVPPAERRLALIHLGQGADARQRTAAFGTQLDFSRVNRERRQWLEGRTLLLPLWATDLQDATAQVRAASTGVLGVQNAVRDNF